MIRLFAAAVLLVSSGAAPASAQGQEASRTGSGDASRRPGGDVAVQRPQLRAASHENYGRMVFDWPARTEYELTTEDGRLVLRFADGVVPDLSAGRRPLRNVLSVGSEAGSVVVATRPGVQVRHFRIGTRIVVDVHDPAGTVQAQLPQAVRAAAAPPRAEAPPPVVAAPRPARPEPVAAPLPVTPAPVAEAPRMEPALALAMGVERDESESQAAEVPPDPAPGRVAQAAGDTPPASEAPTPVAAAEPASEAPTPLAAAEPASPTEPPAVEPAPVIVAAPTAVEMEARRVALAALPAPVVPPVPTLPSAPGLVAAPAAPPALIVPAETAAGGTPVLASLPPAVPAPEAPPAADPAGPLADPAARRAEPATAVAVGEAKEPDQRAVAAEGAPRTGDVTPVQQAQLPPQRGVPPPFPNAGGAAGGNIRPVQLAPGQPIPPLLGGPTTPGAPVAPMPPVARAPVIPTPVLLDPGSGRLLQLPAPAAAVLAADPRVARVQPASPTSLFIMAVSPGRTNVIATADDGSPIVEYDVTVAGAPPAPVGAPPPAFGGPPRGAGVPSASAVESMIRRSVRGGEGVRVVSLAGRGYVLNGLVPTAADAQRAEAIAKAMGGEDREVINNLSLLSSIQVNVRVRVAEMNRTVTRELGFNWDAIGNTGGNWLLGLRFGAAGLITQAIGLPAGSAEIPARYGARFVNSRMDINSVIDALASDNLVTILAEPNLTAQSGEVASFLAGGEFPVPVAGSAAGGAATVTIEFKQFGVGLAFVPTVLSPERLNLRIRPEVSELSESGSISVPLAAGVVRIPALTVRRAETTVELGSGQSFAIAGLLSRSNTLSNSGLQGLGDIPVLGALFRSDRYRRQESELVIIVTPYLVRPVSDPRALTGPSDRFRPATDFDRIILRRQTARGTPTAPVEGRRPAVDAGFIVE